MGAVFLGIAPIFQAIIWHRFIIHQHTIEFRSKALETIRKSSTLFCVFLVVSLISDLDLGWSLLIFIIFLRFCSVKFSTNLLQIIKENIPTDLPILTITKMQLLE